MGDGGTLNRLDPCARIPCTCPTRLSYRLSYRQTPLAGARAKGGLSAARLPGTGGCLRYCVTATLRARRGGDFIGRKYRHRAGTANSRDWQRHVGDDTAGGGGPTSAKRHLSESWGGDEGVKGQSRLAGARSAALEALIATPHHNGAVAVGRSPSDRGCAGPPRRGRLFVG